jgi:hypothetical protein
MHDDLRSALEFIAQADRRTISQYLELLLITHVRATLTNEFDDDGKLVKRTPFGFRPGQNPRRNS